MYLSSLMYIVKTKQSKNHSFLVNLLAIFTKCKKAVEFFAIEFGAHDKWMCFVTEIFEIKHRLKKKIDMIFKINTFYKIWFFKNPFLL